MEEMFYSPLLYKKRATTVEKHLSGGTLKPTIFQKYGVEAIAISLKKVRSERLNLLRAEPRKPQWLVSDDSIARQDLRCFQTAGFVSLKMKYFTFPYSYNFINQIC